MVRNYSVIKYLYFIYIKNRLIYIGRSSKPIIRIRQHIPKLLKNIDEFSVNVYGPYDEWHANYLESIEIHKRKRNKYLLSYTTTKYDNSRKKISVKDYGCKTVFKFRKEGKIKKMVSQYAD